MGIKIYMKELYNRIKNFILSPLYKKRFSICESCENMNKVNLCCNICHCYLPIKVKLTFSKCPIKKW